eukprot:PITA_25024
MDRRKKNIPQMVLGLKGFFTAIFNFLEDRNRVLDGRPYFFNAAGLFLKGWVERFNLDTVDLSWAPVWIRLYSLPAEYWDEESLKVIGNTQGEFVKITEETKTSRYTSYARICVYMDLNQALLDAVNISYFDNKWLQIIDYEHVPFRCRRCHALGHLFRDCPLTQKPSPALDPEAYEGNGFIKVVNCPRAHKKQAPKPKVAQTSQPRPSTSNSFGALADQSETQMNLSEPTPMNDDNPKKGRSTMSETDTHGKEASTSDKQKEILWSTQARQSENPNTGTRTEEEPMEE